MLNGTLSSTQSVSHIVFQGHSRGFISWWAQGSGNEEFLQLYNTIQYKTCNTPYVTKMLFVSAGAVNFIIMVIGAFVL